MPYIKPEDRNRLSTYFDGPEPASAGELNYCLTRVIQNYMFDKKHSYQNYNEVIGVLECCKLELYRRMIAPYEDEAIKRSGDVY